jgi:hypothetical protein
LKVTGNKSDKNFVIITILRAFVQFNLATNVPFSFTCVCVCVCVCVCLFVCLFLLSSSSLLRVVRGHKVATVGDRNVMTSSSRFPKSYKEILLELIFQKNGILAALLPNRQNRQAFVSLCYVFVGS